MVDLKDSGFSNGGTFERYVYYSTANVGRLNTYKFRYELRVVDDAIGSYRTSIILIIISSYTFECPFSTHECRISATPDRFMKSISRKDSRLKENGRRY
jgi:hypothetical protein